MGLTSLHDLYGLWHLYICRSLFGHLTFIVASLLFMKGTSCCVIRRNFKWNWLDWQSSIGTLVYMISAVICMSLCGVWHLCNLPCFYALFWLISIVSYVLKSPSICFQGTKYEINREDVVYLHSVVYLHCRRFYNDMVPKFRNGKRCTRKLEKQNIWLKPEMTDYLCLSSQRILRLPRHSLTFGFPSTCPSVHSPWYQWSLLFYYDTDTSTILTRKYVKLTRFA